MAGEVLADLINGAKSKSDEFADIMYGVIESVSPLSVKVENRFTVSGSNIIVHEVCLEKKVKYDYPEIEYKNEQLTVEGYSDLDATIYVNDITRIQRSYVVSSNGEDQSVSKEPYVEDLDTKQREVGVKKSFGDRKTNKSAVTDFKVKVVQKEITIFEGLKVGERVRMIRGRSGQTFYIVGREV